MHLYIHRVEWHITRVGSADHLALRCGSRTLDKGKLESSLTSGGSSNILTWPSSSRCYKAGETYKTRVEHRQYFFC